MAKLSANGECIIEYVTLHARKDWTDPEKMTYETRDTYRFMGSGYLLMRSDVRMGYATKSKDLCWVNGKWSRIGRIKAALVADHAALKGLVRARVEWMRSMGSPTAITQ